MEHKLGNLLPGEALIYERSNGVVYARYRDKPEIERWVIGGDPNHNLGYGDWKKIFELAEKHPGFKKQLDRFINTYYLLKENK